MTDPFERADMDNYKARIELALGRLDAAEKYLVRGAGEVIRAHTVS